jgi:hypothetical protein
VNLNLRRDVTAVLLGSILGRGGAMGMSNRLETERQDAQAVEEFRLVTELMVVAAQTRGELGQDAVDDALGLREWTDGVPGQRHPR